MHVLNQGVCGGFACSRTLAGFVSGFKFNQEYIILCPVFCPPPHPSFSFRIICWEPLLIDSHPLWQQQTGRRVYRLTIQC